MAQKLKIVRIGLVMLAAILLAIGVGFLAQKPTSAANGTYKILAWNDLGMHCYNKDFSDLAVLPPYNNLWVQVVQAGDPPKLVTSGITVSYSYPDNTYSVGKTNFWTYSKALFGVDLPPNIGLKGKGLAGTMDLSGDHFIAEGIPITEFSDSAPTTRQPYQLATVVVKDSTTGAVLATQSVVTPTSSEMRCDNCHSDTGRAKPEHLTGKVETNILQLHDEEEGTNLMANRPVLCASCHASNALGAPGQPGIPNLSKAMHNKHSGEVPNTLDGCYNCHPGPQTRCLRDVMSTQKGMTCIDCHGNMQKVASNPNPWLNEPRCDTCHNSGQFHQDQALYRFSKEHGGLYCEACHDSTHAIAPSREANDAIKFIALQGSNGPLGAKCLVCHATLPISNIGPHGIGAQTTTFNISGAVGLAGVTLSYTDGTAKTATTDGSGNYSFSVSSGWSGTVTPSKPGFGFTPANRTYTNVTTDQSGQDYTAFACSTTDVTIAGVLEGSYCLASGQSTRQSYAVNNGPVKVGTSGTPILAAQRLLYSVNGFPTSFVEMMGLPASQLDTTYWFPWYKNDGIVDTQLRIGNVSGSTATVHIFIAGVEVTGSPFTLTTSGAGQSQRLSFALNNGPVKVVSNLPIVTSERLIYFNSGVPISFSEMLGLPNSQLSKTYWFPWYKNAGEIDTQLRIGNVSGSTATVHIYIGGVEMTGSPFTLTTSGAGQSLRVSFPVNAGPVKIVSDQNIVAAQRLLYSAGGAPTSFVETMGIPDGQLSKTQWFPWYKNDGIVDTQLQIGNVSGVAASVHIYIGTAEMPGSPFALTASGAGQNLRLSFTANDGPVKLVSDQNIVSAERLTYFDSGVPVSFSEMMGLPDSQLSPTWWLPWYKNIGEIDTQLRFGVP